MRQRRLAPTSAEGYAPLLFPSTGSVGHGRRWINHHPPAAIPSKATLDRLESEVKARGIAVFARIDHAAGATTAGLALRPTELLIFGNAIVGIPLMQAAQTIGIDLPLKALAWEDASGRVWLSYNDPGWLARRHGLDASSVATTGAMTAMLAIIAQKAATAP
jgi:uncharacterized protein (DUF302 family)